MLDYPGGVMLWTLAFFSSIGYKEAGHRSGSISEGHLMTETENLPGRKAPSVAKDDLSRIIEQSVQKLPEETVRCVRVFENSYRCNWWLLEKTAAWGATSTIVRSQFLRVTQSPRWPRDRHC
jgi:hypothetical protein